MCCKAFLEHNLPTRPASCALLLWDMGTGLLFRQRYPFHHGYLVMPCKKFELNAIKPRTSAFKFVKSRESKSFQFKSSQHSEPIYSSTSHVHITVPQCPTLSPSCKPLVSFPFLSPFFLWLSLSLFLSQYVQHYPLGVIQYPNNIIGPS